MSGRTGRLVLQVLAVVAGMLLLFAWNEGAFRERIAGDEGPGEARPGPVLATATAERRSIAKTLEIAAGVHARRSAAVSARIPGVVEEIAVDEGARVRAGDVLVRLSTPDLESRGVASRGAVAGARAALEQARRDADRVRELQSRGAGTSLERERAETALRQAEGALAQARGESRATTTIAGYAAIRAPFDGLVVRRRMDPGDLASPGMPILELVDDSGLHVEADVGESVAAALRVGDAVEIRVDAADLDLEGRIAEVVAAVDPESRTTRVEVEPADARGLRPGLFARVRFRLGTRDAVVVPAAAVRRIGELSVVDVLAPEARIEPRWIEVGSEADGAIEILTGLAAGERVLLHE
jgi:RND family efflux transporter MFP subunit